MTYSRGMPKSSTMIEILIAYLVLGGLTAAAQGRWRLPDLARSTLIWPALLPGMLRGDPSPLDAPALAAWQARIRAALTSLDAAVRQSEALPDASTSRRLLTTTSDELTAVRALTSSQKHQYVDGTCMRALRVRASIPYG